MLVFAADGSTQVMPSDRVIAPAVEDLAEKAQKATERLRLMQPRLPSESENPNAPPPSELPVTSTYFGLTHKVSLSRNAKTVMNLPQSFDMDCPLIAGDLVSLNYTDGDPFRPMISARVSGGDWCLVSYPPGLYTGPCSISRPQPVDDDVRRLITVSRRSETTWFRDESGNRVSIAAGGCSPIRLDSGRYRIYIETNVRLSSMPPCADDETRTCNKSSNIKTRFEGGISIDADLPETKRITDIASLVPAWSGTDPLPSYAELAPSDDSLITVDAAAPDYDPNDYTFVDLLGPVFTHDRCVNCHSFEAPGGKLEIHIEESRLTGFDDSDYEPGKGMSRQLRQWVNDWHKNFGDIGCHDCHNPDKTQLRGFSWLPGIMMAGAPAGPWDRMSAFEICDGLQSFWSFQGPEGVRTHLLDDPRIQWAIRIRWTPIDVIQPAPPVTWDEFVTRVNLWIDKGQMRCRPISQPTPEQERQRLIPKSTPTPTTTPPEDTDRTPGNIDRTTSSVDLESPHSNSCDQTQDSLIAELDQGAPVEFSITAVQQHTVVSTLTDAQIVEANQIAQLMAREPSLAAVQTRWEALIIELKTANDQLDINALVQWVLHASFQQTNADLQFYAAKIRAFNEQKDTIRGTIAEMRDHREEVEEQIAAWEDELQQICDDAQLADVDLQNRLQKQQQALQMMSNIAKMLQDTAMNVIRRIGR